MPSFDAEYLRNGIVDTVTYNKILFYLKVIKYFYRKDENVMRKVIIL